VLLLSDHVRLKDQTKRMRKINSEYPSPISAKFVATIGFSRWNCGQ